MEVPTKCRDSCGLVSWTRIPNQEFRHFGGVHQIAVPLKSYSPLSAEFWINCLQKGEKPVFRPWDQGPPHAKTVQAVIASSQKMYASLQGIILRNVSIPYNATDVRRLLESGDRHKTAKLYEAALQDYFIALWRLCVGDPFEQPYDEDRLSLLDETLASWEKCASWIDQDKVTKGPLSSLWVAAARLWIRRYPLASSLRVAEVVSPLAYALRRRGKRTAALGCIAWALETAHSEVPLSEKGRCNLLELQDLILSERHSQAWNLRNMITHWKPLGHSGFKLMALGRLAEYFVKLGWPSLAKKVAARAMRISAQYPGSFQRSKRMIGGLERLLNEPSRRSLQSLDRQGPLQEIMEEALEALLRGRANAGLVLLVMVVEAITLELWVKHKEIILKNKDTFEHLQAHLEKDKKPEDYFPGPEGWATWEISPTLSIKNYILGKIKAYGSESAATTHWIEQLRQTRNKLAHGHLATEVVEHTTYRLHNVFDWYEKTVVLRILSDRERTHTRDSR